MPGPLEFNSVLLLDLTPSPGQLQGIRRNVCGVCSARVCNWKSHSWRQAQQLGSERRWLWVNEEVGNAWVIRSGEIRRRKSRHLLPSLSCSAVGVVLQRGGAGQVPCHGEQDGERSRGTARSKGSRPQRPELQGWRPQGHLAKALRTRLAAVAPGHVWLGCDVPKDGVCTAWAACSRV